ncbi:MAG: TolC family protein, partial [Desulfobacteraceae bacterium]
MKKNFLILIWILCFFCTVVMPVSAETLPVELTVQAAVTEAIKNNPSIREAANQDAAEETVRSDRADLLPQVSLGYSYTSMNEAPIRNTSGTEMQVSHQNIYSWDVTVVQPLFAGFGLYSKFKISQLENKAKELEKGQISLDIALSTRNACHNLLLAHKLLMVSEHEVATLKAHKRDAELFYREGLISPNDQLKAEVALANALQSNEKAKAQIEKAKLAIKQLLGRALDADIQISDNISSVISNSYDLDQLSILAVKDRPIMQLLDIGLDKLGYSKDIAESGWYPQISLVGSYKQSGKNAWADENDYSNYDESFAAVQVKWNFFSSGKTVAQVNATRRQIKGLEARIYQYRSQVLAEVRSAVLDC